MSATEHHVLKGWVERLGLKDFAKWAIPQRVAYLTGVGEVGILSITVSLILTFSLSRGSEVIVREVVFQAIWVSLGFLLLNAGLIVFALFLRTRMRGDGGWLLALMIVMATFEVFYYIYIAGVFSVASIILAGSVTLARAAFGRKLGLVTLSLGVMGVLSLALFQQLGAIPYGPIFKSNMEEVFSDPVALWSMGVMSVMVLVVVYASLDFTATRMEEALHNLEQTNRELVLTQADLAGAQPLASLGSLVSQLAKELNNTLSISLSFSESAAKDLGEKYTSGIDKEGVSELFNEISASYEAQQRAARLLSQLGDLSMYATQSAYEPVDVNVAVRGSLKALANPVAQAGELVTLHLAENLPRARAHAALLHHVLAHVEANALWALSEGEREKGQGRAPSVEVDTRLEGDEVVYRCTDTGPGMTKEVLQKARTPFFTTRRSKGGVGLGLYIADEVARWAGGSLKIDSEPGRGTTVEIRLPRWEGE